jgi:TonB family protein
MPTRLVCRFLTTLVVTAIATVPALAQTSTPAQTVTVPTVQARVVDQQQDIATYLRQAQQYLNRRQYDEAERMLTRALALVEQQRQAELAIVSGTGFLQVGGAIHEPKKIRDVAPVYPEVARRAGVRGVVVLEVIVDPQGNVTSATVLRSVPLLDQAAIDAVYQWKYTPTLLNGRPTSLRMTVTVRFAL